MLSEEEKNIYKRHLLLEEIGLEGQLKLKNSKVLVVGAGGLGCPVLQYLVAAGVGNIGIADNDVVDKSNLQRQILYGFSSIGKPKPSEAKKRLNDLNPFAIIDTYLDGITFENAKNVLGQYDLIVDCTDNYQTRYLLNDISVLLNKPLIYGAIHKFEGQVSVFNLNGGATYRCLYPVLPSPESTVNCSEAGVLGVLPGIIGSLQANEVIKIVTGVGTPLSGKLQVFNLLKNQWSSFLFERKSNIKYDELLAGKEINTEDYSVNCSLFKTEEISPVWNEFEQIIDVRNPDEMPKVVNNTVVNIPLYELSERLNEINLNKKTLVFCQSGIRSQKAIAELKELTGLINVENLEGGINSFLESK